MDSIKQIMSTQLTETEVMVYLLVESGLSFRDIEALPFGFSYTTAKTIYDKAKPKMEAMAEAGLFSTVVE